MNFSSESPENGGNVQDKVNADTTDKARHIEGDTAQPKEGGDENVNKPPVQSDAGLSVSGSVAPDSKAADSSIVADVQSKDTMEIEPSPGTSSKSLEVSNTDAKNNSNEGGVKATSDDDVEKDKQSTEKNLEVEPMEIDQLQTTSNAENADSTAGGHASPDVMLAPTSSEKEDPKKASGSGAPSNGVGPKFKYAVHTVVYKKFGDDWFFGFVEEIIKDEKWYCIRYEDGDSEDLDERQMDEYVVKFDNGDIAVASVASSESMDSERKPNTTSGTADIVSYDDRYKHLDREHLSQYIEKRSKTEELMAEAADKLNESEAKQKKETDKPKKRSRSRLTKPKGGVRKVPEPRPFPSCEPGTVVYKCFGSQWFFGYVARIDKEAKLYGVIYEDGDKEEIDDEELNSIVVRTENGILAMTARKPDPNKMTDWDSVDLKDVTTPGTANIVKTNDMYSNLDRISLVRFIRKRHAEHQEAARRASRRSRTSSSTSPQSPAKRMRTSGGAAPASGPKLSLTATKGFYDKETGQIAERVCDFFRFLHERHSICVRINADEWLPSKDGGQQDLVPTNDEILRHYSFCNVYRELDRGTGFFHAHVVKLRESKKEWTDQDWLETVLWATYVYRLVNRLETFAAIGIPSLEEVDEFKAKAEKLYAEKNVFFTNAHQTTKFGTFLNNIRSASRSNGQLIRRKAAELLAVTTTKECLDVLQTLDSIGPFMSWQLFCDLRESGCLLQCQNDKYCILGPGALKGLDIIFTGSGLYLDYAYLLVNHHDEAFAQIGVQFPFWNGRKLTIKEIEHGLCEYSKYVALQKNRTGGKNRLYQSRAHMDLSKPCHFCKEDSSDGNFCDTCREYYCRKCVPSQASGAFWTCGRCISFALELGISEKNDLSMSKNNGRPPAPLEQLPDREKHTASGFQVTEGDRQPISIVEKVESLPVASDSGVLGDKETVGKDESLLGVIVDKEKTITTEETGSSIGGVLPAATIVVEGPTSDLSGKEAGGMVTAAQSPLESSRVESESTVSHPVEAMLTEAAPDNLPAAPSAEGPTPQLSKTKAGGNASAPDISCLESESNANPPVVSILSQIAPYKEHDEDNKTG
ncbi:hypothetical protein ACA910_018512 [Epithemia clementina (nom. ined.)]